MDRSGDLDKDICEGGLAWKIRRAKDRYSPSTTLRKLNQRRMTLDTIANGDNLTTRPAVPRLRIAQVAPLYESIPPKLYGGTERVVSYITEELVRRGHHVTLFASGDAQTGAKLAPGCPQSLRLAGKPEVGIVLQLPMLTDVYDQA